MTESRSVRPDVGEALLAALDIALFAPTEHGLEPVHELPAWLRAIRPEENWLDPTDELPFLANFLVDATEFWNVEREPNDVARICSGPWTEACADGSTHALEASALVAGTAKFLLVERCGTEFVERQRVLQRAREVSLDRHRLERAERRIAEMHAALEERHGELLYLFDRLALGTVLLDADGGVSFLSRTAAEWLETEAEGVGAWERIFEAKTDAAAELARRRADPEGATKRLGVRFERKHAAPLFFDVDVQVDPRAAERRIVFLYDRTEVRELRAALAGRARFEDLVGKSALMQAVYELIDDLAPYGTTVLIEGETGTGKELVARALHQRGTRSAGPFVPVNCAGFTESLLNSQLFGHKRGAFTGATTDQAGYFEAADGGTLFLDEIGDISLDVQTRLLRVLQEREITRVGETQTRKVDVRVVCATHRNLVEEVEAGRFRSDLLYRIRVGRIGLPALADRREDVPLLANAFLTRIASELGKDVTSIAPEALELMLDYAWPGNVRELRSAIEFGLVRAKGRALAAGDLPPEVLALSGGRSGGFGGAGGAADDRTKVLAALRSAGGNRSQAAKLLGVSRATFYRRLASLDLDEG